MNPTRRTFLRTTAGLASIGLASRFLSAADEPAKPPAMFSGPLETERLGDDLVALLGAGGNSAVLFNEDRVLFVDSGVPNRGPELVAVAAKLSPNASHKTLFNTHWHFDHTGGNAAFVKAGYTVVGSTACRTRLGQTITFEDMGMTTQPSPESSRPTVTFDRGLDLFEPTRVTITKVAPAHTDTDAVAYFEKQNVLHAGDLLFSSGFPVIDRTTGGSLDGMIAASKTLLSIGDNKTKLIPGHGPIGGKEVAKAQLELLELARERLAPFGDKKATMDEVLAAKPFADLDDKWGRGFIRSPLFTRMTYGQWLTK